MTSTHGNDPYTSKAAQDASPSQKIEELKTVSTLHCLR